MLDITLHSTVSTCCMLYRVCNWVLQFLKKL